MENLTKILAEAAEFRNRRHNLAKNLKSLSEKEKREKEKLESEHNSKISNLQSERQANEDADSSRAQKEIAGYTQIKNRIQEQVKPFKKKYKSSIERYIPKPESVDEDELTQIVEKIQEQGLMAWIKRTFSLDGYASRPEMARNLCFKAEDYCAYCDVRIERIESETERRRSERVTETRRRTEAENDRFVDASKKQASDFERKRNEASAALSRFDASAELKNMHESLKQMKSKAESVCGAWGKYSVPAAMPEEVLLCDVKTTLPNKNGAEESVAFPLSINLYKSHIIVVTSNSGTVSSADSKEKQFVRKFLARMLKTVPPECCNYSIFDSLIDGASLGRLIDVTNIGTTDLKFDLFTSNTSSDRTVSCGEKRKHLCSLPEKINKHTAGKYASLFEYSKETGDFEYPFTWYVDFNFPDAPDNRMLEDIEKLFANASMAGYSFMFVTTPNGYQRIKELASRCTSTSILHVDMENAVCETGDVQVAYCGTSAPSTEQIYNFTTALKAYYEDGNAIDNRIDSVYKIKGVELRDASEKLSIPMALDSRGRLVDLELGGDGSVHGFISGGTNCGKTTLLHTIILSACLHYHPDDLEIWLVDYKQIEFHLYKEVTPPHVKLIGISKTPDFTFSLLDKIEAEANHRNELMHRFNVNGLKEYRKHKGERGYENIRRLLVVIDEFHEMSQFVTEEITYRTKLENCLREYRAQGINFLLADQTFNAGLNGLPPAAKDQIGFRIAMRNEDLQEIKNTLQVDSALYSDSMQHTMRIMSQGDFIMKSYVRDKHGVIENVKLEKCKALHAKQDDIKPISQALCYFYRGQYQKNRLYVNTTEHVAWDDAEPSALDAAKPTRYPNIRFYLGRAATLEPCFGVDMGRQPHENMSIVGGTAYQRWELLSSIMRSCKYKGYKLLVFMAEYSDLMNDYAPAIRRMCQEVPKAELMETYEAWCAKLGDLANRIDSKAKGEDTVCVFIGLEIAKDEFDFLPDKNANQGRGSNSTYANILRYAAHDKETEPMDDQTTNTEEAAFNAMPLIHKLLSFGPRCGIRCITEVSVYKQFKELRIEELFRHRVAFSMTADDCMLYIGNSGAQKVIGEDAVYSDGGREVKKLLPYKM